MATQSRGQTSSTSEHAVSQATSPERVLTVFISFADDARAQAKEARHIVELVSTTWGQRTGVSLRPYLWNHDQSSDLGSGDAQSLINKELRKCAFFVGIMACRFGSPTPRAASGMEEEYKLALRCKKTSSLPMFKLTYYFSRKKVDPFTIDLTQLDLVRQFKDMLAAQGLYRAFTSPTMFREQFREDLEKHANEWYDYDQNRTRARERRQMEYHMTVSAKSRSQALSASDKETVEATKKWDESVHLPVFGTSSVKARTVRKPINTKTPAVPKKNAGLPSAGKAPRDATKK